MYTEDDLRATFGTLEHQAPTVGETLAGVEKLRHRRTTRRRVAGMAAAVVITAAVTAGSLAAPSLFRSDTPEQVQPARATPGTAEFSFAVDDIAGFRTFYQIATGPSLGQLAKVFETSGEYPRDTNQQPYALNVFEAGEYDPTAARAGEQIDVAGKPGFYRPDMPCHCSGEPPIGAVAWEYAPNTWALVQYFNREDATPEQVKANLIRIASAVRFDKTTPVRVPFRVGWLPDGLRLSGGDMFTWDPERAGASIGFTSTTPGQPGLNISMFHIPGAPSDMQVGEPKVITLPTSAGGEPPMRGEPAVPGGGALGNMVVVNVGPFTVQLESHGATPDLPGLPTEELVKIARSITAVGGPLDRSAWIEASKALPAR